MSKPTEQDRKQLQAKYGYRGYRVLASGEVHCRREHVEGPYWAFAGWTVAEALALG